MITVSVCACHPNEQNKKRKLTLKAPCLNANVSYLYPQPLIAVGGRGRGWGAIVPRSHFHCVLSGFSPQGTSSSGAARNDARLRQVTRNTRTTSFFSCQNKAGSLTCLLRLESSLGRIS